MHSDLRQPRFQPSIPPRCAVHLPNSLAVVGEDVLSVLASHIVDDRHRRAIQDNQAFFTILYERIGDYEDRGIQFGYFHLPIPLFEKYSKRLHEEIELDEASGPAYILAPYFMASGPDDDWWTVSTKLFERTSHHVADNGTCIRVIAVTMPHDLFSLIQASGQNRAAVWVNALDDRNSAPEMLAAYLASLASAHRNGVDTFALYGGFFSVIRSIVGLGGSSHGVGYGEHREYLELPQSGPPPARYYVPMIHRYVTQEVAIKLWQADKSLVKCDCAVCSDHSVVDLEYHDLMKHSVLCRSQEILDWTNLSLALAKDRLVSEKMQFLDVLASSSAPSLFQAEASQYVSHIDSWTTAIEIYESFDDVE